MSLSIVCLDLEGVLIPEIWINFAESVKIDELKLTTRDISDYDVLMNKRIGILKENGLTLPDIQQVIEGLDPLPGAKEFLDALRERTQVIILSDTFTQFASPMMRKLGWPTLFCNTLETDADGTVTGYRLRQQDGKKKAVKALSSIGFSIIAAGDSYNDVSMLKTADAGIFFRPPDTIIDEFPQIPVTREYSELLTAIEEAAVTI